MNIITSYFMVKPLRGSLNLSCPLTPRSIAARQQEYLHCLHRNSAHADVRYIHLLVEGLDAYEHLCTHVLCSATFRASQRCKIIPFLRLTKRMPTYADLFAHANRVLAPRNDYAMICNADVYLHPRYSVLAGIDALFSARHCSQHRVAGNSVAGSRSSALSVATTRSDEEKDGSNDVCRFAPNDGNADLSSALSSSQFSERNACGNERCNDVTSLSSSPRLTLALTRYESESVADDEENAPLIRDYRGSHDAFIARPPFPCSFLAAVDHNQNSYQAENVVIHELRQHGYRVINPCHDVRIVHAHTAEVRQWLPSIAAGRYARAEPVLLKDALRQM